MYCYTKWCKINLIIYWMIYFSSMVTCVHVIIYILELSPYKLLQIEYHWNFHDFTIHNVVIMLNVYKFTVQWLTHIWLIKLCSSPFQNKNVPKCFKVLKIAVTLCSTNHRFTFKTEHAHTYQHMSYWNCLISDLWKKPHVSHIIYLIVFVFITQV